MNLQDAHPLLSAGELKPAEIDKVLDVIAKPEDYKVMLASCVARTILPSLLILSCCNLLYIIIFTHSLFFRSPDTS